VALADIRVLTSSDDEVDIPVVLAIGLEPDQRIRLARSLDGIGVVVMVPDARTARDLLDRVASRPLGGPQAEVIDLAGLEVDRSRHDARWHGASIDLTRLERAILACLMADQGRVSPFERIYQEAWGTTYLGDPSAVHSVVKRLRRKLRAAGVEMTIEAVRGVGFELVQRSPRPANPTMVVAGITPR
jgi:two-component system response regulator MtrA